MFSGKTVLGEAILGQAENTQTQKYTVYLDSIYLYKFSYKLSIRQPCNNTFELWLFWYLT